MLAQLITILFCFALFGCGGKKQPKAAADSSAGSCEQKDPTNNGRYCVEGNAFTSARLCKAAGATWSDAACDTSKYERKCVTEGEVSVDNGPTEKSTETSYFSAGSKMACLGEETKLNEKSRSSKKNPAEDDSDSDKSESQEGSEESQEDNEQDEAVSTSTLSSVALGKPITWQGTLTEDGTQIEVRGNLTIATSGEYVVTQMKVDTPERCSEGVRHSLLLSVSRARDQFSIASRAFSSDDRDNVELETWNKGDQMSIKLWARPKAGKISGSCPFTASFVIAPSA